MSCKLKQGHFGIRIDKVDQWGGGEADRSQKQTHEYKVT